LLEPYLSPSAAADDTLIVVTADHGESLGEHGEATHGLFGYEATLRVPLIVAGPGLPVRDVAEPAQHVDLVPTILTALGLPAPGGLPGRDLLGTTPATATYFEALSASRNRGWAPLTGLVDGNLKVIDLPIPELYDLAADPHELTNLAVARPADLARLSGHLARIPGREDVRESLRADAETRERLGALGYLSRPEPVAALATPDRDPKRLIVWDQALQAAIGRFESGDVSGARAQALQLVAQAPRMTIAWLQLAYFERAAGDRARAVAAARQAVRLSPDDDGALALLGAYLNEAGRPGECVAALRARALRPEADPDVLTAWAIATAQAGHAAEALLAFDRLVASDASDAEALANRGTLRLMQGDRAGARADLEAALARDPGLGRASNTLGVIAAEAGDRPAAIAYWQAAAKLDDSDPDTLFNLGKVLFAEGRREEARPYLERFLKSPASGTRREDVARVRAWLGTS
jgi:Tfp pilus assembly protein PilF